MAGRLIFVKINFFGTTFAINLSSDSQTQYTPQNGQPGAKHPAFIFYDG